MQTLSLSNPPTEVVESGRLTRMRHDILDRSRRFPACVGRVHVPVADGHQRANQLPLVRRRQGRRRPEAAQPADSARISPGFFRTLGTPLIGDAISRGPISLARASSDISENLRARCGVLQRRRWASGFGRGNWVWRDMVGVTGDIYDEGIYRRPHTTLFLGAIAREQSWASALLVARVTFVIRSGAHRLTASLRNQAREAVWSVNANLPLAQVRRLATSTKSMARTSFTLVIWPSPARWRCCPACQG